MKSIVRLYLTTSKGIDPFLYKELLSFNIKPKFDDTLHAFYFEAPLPTLFRISHRSLITENMYLQVGQPIPATSETVFAQRLERIQFKNYLPLRRGLVENMTLSILVRETKYPLSDNVMSSFLRNALQKEIVKREYFQEVLQGDIRRDALPSYYEMREIVSRKWEQEDTLAANHQALLEAAKPDQLPLLQGRTTSRSRSRSPVVQTDQESSPGLPESYLPYHPHLTIYVRRNKARLLLKINEQVMYKLGWKKKVGWAPIRESIATAVLSQAKLLQQKEDTYLWDPFCGSGTIGLVAAAMFYGAWVRMDSSNFNWHHWNIFKPEYLKEYFENEKKESENKLNKLHIICTDISFQAANYSIGNLKELAGNLEKNTEDKDQTKTTDENDEKASPVVRRIKPTEHWKEVMNGQWVVGCGDFEKLAENILLTGRKVNIVTNLPYLKARSADHMPLSQLVSVYRRFSKMIKQNRDRIANVFIVIDNSSSNLSNPSHFLAVSEEKWVVINSFESGGMPVGLYAWEHNEIQAKHEDTTALINSLNQEAQLINDVPDEELSTALSKYRKRVAEVEKKTYYLPDHLKKVRRGWRIVKEKRRRRHLLIAYQAFAQQRDKMMAFAEYANKKLEVKMLKRGSVWRKRNMKLLTGLPIENIQKELKKEFEGRIQEALKLNVEKEDYRKERAKQANERTRQYQRQMRNTAHSSKSSAHSSKPSARSPRSSSRSPRSSGKGARSPQSQRR